MKNSPTTAEVASVFTGKQMTVKEIHERASLKYFLSTIHP